MSSPDLATWTLTTEALPTLPDRTGTLRLGFAAWKGVVGYPSGVRALWTARLSFAKGKPVLN